MRLKQVAIALSFCGAFPLMAYAGNDIGIEARTGTILTIYNDDLALVGDTRNVPVNVGENKATILEVSSGILPQSAWFSSKVANVGVIEQNFEYDVLNIQTLLQKSIGKTIRVFRVHPESGEDRAETATVLAASETGIVLQIGDRIEVSPPGRLVFSAVPEDLHARPSLSITFTSDRSGTIPIDLFYLTHGLSWSSDYAATLSADEKSLSVNGWVTLTNNSGIDYKDAKLQVVAGRVNQVTAMPAPQTMAVSRNVEMMAKQDLQPEGAFDYHLYKLDRTATVKANQTKSLSLMSAQSVPVNKDYRFTNVALIAGNYGQPANEMPLAHAATTLRIVNDEASGLGIPLPKGIVRVYKKDSDGNAILLGEDEIDHTPKGEKIDLNLGQAFDVTARAKQTEFQRISDHVYENAYEMVIMNAKDNPISVSVQEYMPGEWDILSETHTHKKIDANNTEWEVKVPAGGSTVLRYRVRLTI